MLMYVVVFLIIIILVIVIMKIIKNCYMKNDKITVNEEKLMKFELQNVSEKDMNMINIDPHLE